MSGELIMMSFIKNTAVCILWFFLTTTCSTAAIAGSEFIVKYKLNEEQQNTLANASVSGEIARANAEKAIRIEIMKKGLSEEQKNYLLKSANSVSDKITQIMRIIPIAIGAFSVSFDNDLDEKQVEEFIKKISNSSDIEYIEAETRLVLEVTAVPLKDINPDYQWDMVDKTGFTKKPQWTGDNFFKAWKLVGEGGGSPGRDVVIAVLDTGYTPHPNFINNLLPSSPGKNTYGYKFISDCRSSGECSTIMAPIHAQNHPHSRYEEDGLDLGDFLDKSDIANLGLDPSKHKPSDSSWHGSHVIGTIVASGYDPNSNPDYITGGAYGAKVIPIRVLGKMGGVERDIINGMLWAAGHPVLNVDGSPIPNNPNPAKIINMSLGNVSQFGCSRAYQNTINQLTSSGVIVVVSAGNASVDIKGTSLASCNGMVSVAAIGPDNKLAFYSNYGNTTLSASGGNYNVLGDLSMIYSTVWSSSQVYEPSPYGSGVWKAMQGTSMAAPHVTAAIAILIGEGGAADYNSLVHILQKNARNYGNCNNTGCATNYALDVENATKDVLGKGKFSFLNLNSDSFAGLATVTGIIVIATTAYVLYFKIPQPVPA